MSNINTLRTHLTGEQDARAYIKGQQPWEEIEASTGHGTFAQGRYPNGPLQPRPSAFKSRQDRDALTILQYTSNLYQAQVFGRGWDRSSEAGERERRTQAQHSRGFYLDRLPGFQKLVAALSPEVEYEPSLAEEVTQQERDFGPEPDEYPCNCEACQHGDGH